MRRLLLATAAGAAFLASATAASAQYYDHGHYHGYHGPFVERGVGLQIGPVGIGVYDNTPRYYGGYEGGYVYRDGTRTNSTEESTAFRSQRWYPQSPPEGGY